MFRISFVFVSLRDWFIDFVSAKLSRQRAVWKLLSDDELLLFAKNAVRRKNRSADEELETFFASFKLPFCDFRK
jgi:hypothetical protein